MPKLPDTTFPVYRLHKSSGQAVVTLDGHDEYLGEFNTAPSKARYDQLIAEWIAHGRRRPVAQGELKIAELVVAFRRHAQTYYRDADGNLSRAVENIDEALKPLVKLFGLTPAAQFGPLKLKAVRDTMIVDDRVRQNVNRHIVRIRSVFKWAAENELIPASVHHGLMALAGLRAGRSGAREGVPVKPVALEHVETVLPHVSKQVAAMARLQMFTGMRPGEVVLMRGMDLDTTGKLWVYKPAKHKTQIHGKVREIFLGARSQEVVKPLLNENVTPLHTSIILARKELLNSGYDAPLNWLSVEASPGCGWRKERDGTFTAYRNAIDVTTVSAAAREMGWAAQKIECGKSCTSSAHGEQIEHEDYLAHADCIAMLKMSDKTTKEKSKLMEKIRKSAGGRSL